MERRRERGEVTSCEPSRAKGRSLTPVSPKCPSPITLTLRGGCRVAQRNVRSSRKQRDNSSSLQEQLGLLSLPIKEFPDSFLRKHQTSPHTTSSTRQDTNDRGSSAFCFPPSQKPGCPRQDEKIPLCGYCTQQMNKATSLALASG